jgi:hypothetical protein
MLQYLHSKQKIIQTIYEDIRQLPENLGYCFFFYLIEDHEYHDSDFSHFQNVVFESKGYINIHYKDYSRSYGM